MKRKLFILMLAACSLLSCTDGIWDAIHGLENKYSDLDARVAYLEELCSEMNTNISALQTLVSVILTNDYIISIAPITKDGQEIGYVITFAIHEPITIYHGQNGQDGADGKDGTDGKDGENGKDGADGKDGQDGTTPIIGVALDPTDNAYYWTLNGEWLLDENGNRIPLTSRDGQDGEDGTDGEDGKDGADGQDGKDGVTPQLKIEDGYWYVSIDNGATWTQLGKATGEDGVDGKDGQNGADGKDGQDGDSMFQSVTQDDDFVYFTLADGTIIKIAKGNGNSQSNNDFIFTITYDSNGGTGIMEKDTCNYGQVILIDSCTYHYNLYKFTSWNSKRDGTGATYYNGTEIAIDRNITLYAQWIEDPHTGIANGYQWVDLGLSVKWATCNIGANRVEQYGDYFAWGEVDTKTKYTWDSYKWCNASYNRLTKYNFHASFGQRDNKYHLDSSDDAAIDKWGGNWRMPTDTEQSELRTKCSWKWTTKNGVNGYEITSKVEGYTNSKIFLPAAGYMSEYTLYDVQDYGYYWSSDLDAIQHSVGYRPDWACIIKFNTGESSTSYDSRHYGYSIRPVCP